MKQSDSAQDVLVIGGGIAGMFAALRLSRTCNVTLVTKATLSDSNTRYAQGGIAAVLFPDDSVESHIADTIAAGDGMCDKEAVRVLCTEGPDRIYDLLQFGVAFDRNGNELARGLEAAHTVARVLHAGGDATGSAIQFALVEAMHAAGIVVHENTFLTKLVVKNGIATGAEFLDPFDRPLTLSADAVVLATGGAGQTYKYTTNPAIATGDGVACAYRAGANIADAEMYQFHPTMFVGEHLFLVSEAVRGEGAILRNDSGERFMPRYHPLAELAPRDVVARAIATEMELAGGKPVVLDATGFEAGFLATRFPNIDRHCRDAGFDLSRQPIPIAPAAHFWMGGVATDLWGQSSIPRLFAIGEVARTGVHGANRLASNSLLEGLVFANRAAQAIENGQLEPVNPSVVPTTPNDIPDGTSLEKIGDVQELAWNHIGLVRDAHGLRLALKQLNIWSADPLQPSTKRDFEKANVLCVAQLIASSALAHRESRGAHFRSDFPPQPR